MYVAPLVHITGLGVRPAQVPTNGTGNLGLGTLKAPKNGNPGIVPPWLQGTGGVNPNVIGIDPVDPDVPTIM